MAYHHDQQFYKKRKKSRHFLRATSLVVIVMLLASGYIFFDWLRNNLRDGTVVGVGSESTVQSASINIFRSPYFQFQTDKTWREVTESTPQAERFVYRSFDGPLIQHELIVEVNSANPIILDNTQNTRVLPVELVQNRMKAVGEISPHCNEFIDDPNNRNQQIVAYKDASFACNPDGSTFITVVSLIAGSETIENTHSDGTETTYRITYRDSTFSPNGRPLDNIVNTFQLL